MDQEKTVELAEKAMDFSEKSIFKLNFKESYKYWKALKFIADRMQVIPDKETGELRRDIVKQSEIFLDRMVQFPLAESAAEKLHGKNVFMPALFNDRFNFIGMEILKDCALMGYTLSKLTGSGAYFYFYDIPAVNEFFRKFLPDIKTIQNRSATFEDQIAFLHDNFPLMDILMIYGVYKHTAEYIREYKRLRPDGLVHVAMDITEFYYNRLKESDTLQTVVIDTMEAGSVCSVANDDYQNFSNENILIPKPCYFITNGFMKTQFCERNLPRENVILSVGRIGTPEKYNELLLYAFTAVSPHFPDWKIKLVGPVDDYIKPWLDDYFKTNPSLRDKIIMPDRIYEKDELYDEYAKSKIFCLTSLIESVPNVYAEALYFGNFVIVPNTLPSHKLMTANGKIGKSYIQHNGEDLAHKLVEAIQYTQNGLSEYHLKRTREHYDRYFNYEKISKRIAYHLSEVEK